MQYKRLKYFCVPTSGAIETESRAEARFVLVFFFFFWEAILTLQHIDLLKFSCSPLHWETDVESLRNKFAVTFSPSSNQNMCTAYKSLPALQRRSRTTCTRVAEVAREHGWHPPKSLDSDENFKPEHTLFCRELRFVAIYALFLEIFGHKKCLFG